MSNGRGVEDTELGHATDVHGGLSVGERILVARRVLERALTTADLALERKARSAILALLSGLGPVPLPSFLLLEARHHVQMITDALPNSPVALIELAGLHSLEGDFAASASAAVEGLDLTISDEDWQAAAVAASILLDALRRLGESGSEVAPRIEAVLANVHDASSQIELYCRLINLQSVTGTLNEGTVERALSLLTSQKDTDTRSLVLMAQQVLASIARYESNPDFIASVADRVRALSIAAELDALAEGLAIEALSRTDRLEDVRDRITTLVASLDVRPGETPPAHDPRAYGPLLTSASVALRVAEGLGTSDPPRCRPWVSLLFDCLAAFAYYGPPPSMGEDGLAQLWDSVEEVHSRAGRLAEALLLLGGGPDTRDEEEVRPPLAEEVYRVHRDSAPPSIGSPPTRPDKLARLSEAKFAALCASYDWKLIPTPLEVDFGIDYRVEIPNEPGKTSDDVEFLVQLKSTSKQPDRRGRLKTSIDVRTINYWNSKLLPLLLVLYHQPNDRFYGIWHTTEPAKGKSRSYYFSAEDELSRPAVAAAASRYYEAARTALTSRGAASVFSRVLAESTTLLSILLANKSVANALVDPAGDGSEFDQTFMTVVLVLLGRLEAPLPLIATDAATAEIVTRIRAIVAIRNSWWYTGGSMEAPFQLGLVSGKRFWEVCRHLVLALADLSAFLAVQLAGTKADAGADESISEK